MFPNTQLLETYWTYCYFRLAEVLYEELMRRGKIKRIYWEKIQIAVLETIDFRGDTRKDRDLTRVKQIIEEIKQFDKVVNRLLKESMNSLDI